MQKYIIGCLLLLLCACQEERLEQGLQGGFLIALSEVSADVETRTAPADLPAPVKTEFQLTIRNQETNEEQKAKYSDQVIPVEAGTYTLTAEFGENPDLGFDQPYYKGEVTDQTVRDGYTKKVSIPCKVANALVSIRIKEEDQAAFEKNFPEAYAQISVGSVKDRMWTDLNTSAYFKAGSTLSQLILYKDHDGGELNLLEAAEAKVPKPFQAGDHLIITLGLQGQNGNLSLVVEKAEIKEENISETIPMEWLPRPKIAGFDAEGAKEITYTETADAVPAVLSFSGAMKIEDVEMTLDFKDTKYVSLNKKYTLSTLTDEDKGALTNAGIVLPVLGEAKESNINFSGLIANLTVASGDETTNTIKLRVKANNRWSSEEGEEDAFTIKTIAPEIVPTAKPEDIWTKTLTVSGCEVKTGKLDPSAIQKYQYLDGSEWKDCMDGLAVLSSTPANNQMQVRAMYREGVYAKPVSFELEKPEQLPNSGMEEWTNDNYKNDYYSFNPWREKNDNIHWDTSNLFTTRHRNNGEVLGVPTIANYNGFHSVSYVSGRNGLAAELRSTANGRGNTRADIPIIGVKHTEQNYNKVAGELFTGTTKVTMGTDPGVGDSDGSKDTYEQEKSAAFTNRPTALKFWYKYVPYNSDTWSVHIELLDEAKNVIIQQDFTSSEAKNDWTEAIVSLDYKQEILYAKCKYIYVIFCSTTNPGANMPYREITQTFYVDGQTKTFSPAYVGSVLTIDDISLVYDK